MTSLHKFEPKIARSTAPVFSQLAAGVEVGQLLLDVIRQPELWNKNPCRLSKHAPHHETQDMILRYRDESTFRDSGKWATFCDEHIPEWNRTIDYLPSARKIIFDLMAYVKGEILGGVFIYKLQPGTKIFPHVDPGWHPNFYDKFNVCLTSNPQTTFCYENAAMVQARGDIHWFRNDVKHWVSNEGDTDHIVMTVCIRLDRGHRGPWSPEGWHPDGRE